jgi:hypothetical protein
MTASAEAQKHKSSWWILDIVLLVRINAKKMKTNITLYRSVAEDT